MKRKKFLNDIELRDYFAAKALVGLLTMPDEWSGYFKKDGLGATWKKEAAKAAYELADEMMNARPHNAELTGRSEEISRENK